MAAPIPRQHNSDYTFSPEFLGIPIPATNAAATGQESPNIFDNNALINMKPFLMSSDINSPVSVGSFPEQFGVPDFMELSEREMDFYKKQQVFEPGEEYYSGLIGANLWPPYNHMAADNWGLQDKQLPKVEEPEVKVGRYSVEERKDRILRYLKKRNQRNFTKTIKYACRKTLADKRVRIRGRFARNNEPSDQDQNIINTSANSFEQNFLHIVPFSSRTLKLWPKISNFNTHPHCYVNISFHNFRVPTKAGASHRTSIIE
ncbi:hypothetical protein CDL12_22939 [Handroanthus impetiginosus]|uniref:CCT domain-containing protein n=1 Tax=Handroanthus impetiginosus TaxID=429701 RepID=A0A2G9GGV6_9LAMI|nr:hypothetical protein CDL12_22939 [Handroanthus impetiginosus]